MRKVTGYNGHSGRRRDLVTKIIVYYAGTISHWFSKSPDQNKVVAEIPNES